MTLNRPVLLFLAIAAGLFLQYGPVRPSIETAALCESAPAPGAFASAALFDGSQALPTATPAVIHLQRMENGDLLLIARFSAPRENGCGKKV